MRNVFLGLNLRQLKLDGQNTLSIIMIRQYFGDECNVMVENVLNVVAKIKAIKADVNDNFCSKNVIQGGDVLYIHL